MNPKAITNGRCGVVFINGIVMSTLKFHRVFRIKQGFDFVDNFIYIGITIAHIIGHAT